MLCQCKLVLSLLVIGTDPIFILVRKLYFSLFGILTYCLAKAFGREPSFSSVHFRSACFIASSYVFCSFKNIRPPQKPDCIFLFLKQFKGFPSCLYLYILIIYLLTLHSLFLRLFECGSHVAFLNLCLVYFPLCESVRLWVSSLCGYFMKVLFCAIPGWVKVMCWIYNWKHN